jgi:hypothetical protein
VLGGIEPELVLFGLTVLVLSYLFRPSVTGTRQQFLVTLVSGLLMVIGGFVLPHL